MLPHGAILQFQIKVEIKTQFGVKGGNTLKCL